MIITVVVRTHNEELNLKRFVTAYHDWVDYILIQDDESDDINYLVDVIEKFPKTQLDFYNDKRIIRGDVTRAYHHLQLNHLIEWAEELKSDWIIMDDCDSIPNKQLHIGARQIIESCPKDFVYVTRLNFYKDKGYFPEFSNPKGKPGYCLWAWRANKGFRFLENGDRAQTFTIEDRENVIYKLDPPFVLLHYPWPNDEVIAEKRKRYTAIYGQEYSKFDPLNFAGKLDEPPWYGKS